MNSNYRTKMSFKTIAALTLSAYLFQGCATLEKSALLGAGIGGSFGTGVGLAAGQDAGSALIGLGIGAIVGTGLGLLAHEDKENKEAVLKALRGKRKEVVQEPPMLKAAEASCYKVDEKIDGEEYFGPQLRCKIEKNAVWGLK